MEARGHKVLFVCPTNKLAQENLENGVTLNSFFGVGMTDDATQRMPKFDDSIYDVIVFDEVKACSLKLNDTVRAIQTRSCSLLETPTSYKP